MIYKAFLPWHSTNIVIREASMQENEMVRNEIPAHVVDRLENEWRLVLVEPSPLKPAPELDVTDNIISAPADDLNIR